MQVLVGARIFDGERFLDDHALVIDGGRIAGLTSYAERPRGDGERDLGGGLIAPGFIDVQVNGGGGALMNENPSVETVVRIAESHRRFGTTGLLPTLVTDAREVAPAAIAAVREARQRLPGILGIHLEGPFIDPKRRGAHEPQFIREITEADVVALAQAKCGAVMTTIAPNRVPVHFVKELAAHDVLISLGHAEASCAEASAALVAGARAFTHLFNAMDGTLAGSVLTMDEAVRYCVESIGLGLADALAMATLVPAAFLRRQHELGRVAPGYLASLVHLSEDLSVCETWIEGR
jgi:N-acetylglucosamine-6-phosphate deacetylase